MRPTARPLLFFVVALLPLGLRAAEAPPKDDPILFHEPFKEKLSPGWSWAREDPKHWRITDKGLQVHIQPGNMWGPANDAKNILLRPVPDPEKQPVQITASIANHPTSQYEQTDLVWYYDDGHMVKIGQEMVDGQLSIVMGREQNDKTRTIAIIPLNSDTVDLRLEVKANQINGLFKTPKSDWRPAGQCDLPKPAAPNSTAPRIALQFYQGPEREEHWATVSSFTVRRLP